MSRRVLGRAGLSGLQAVGPAFAGRRVRRGVPLAVERRLPLPGEVLVSPGEEVQPDTPVARALDVPAKLHLVEVAPVLDQPFGPEDVRRAVTVRTGDAVRAGETLARTVRAGWIDRSVQEVSSPVEGVVEFVSLGRGQIIIRARGEERRQRVTLYAAGHLGIEPQELPALVRCRPGQRIEVGDLLARGPGLLLLANEFRSPVSGVVEAISSLSGTITVFQEPRTVVVRAYLEGRVESVTPGYGARIASHGHRVLGVLGLGGKSWGRLVLLGDGVGTAGGRLPVLQANDVAPEFHGCVLLFPGEVTAAALYECRRHGVRGVIGASARAAQLAEFLGRPLAAEIVTGPGALALPAEPGDRTRESPAQEPGLTVVLTEGLGRLAMDAEVWTVLGEHSGKTVSLDGLTQIRAGVVRPVALLPLPGEGPDGGASSTGAHPPAPGEAVPIYALPELTSGMRVRLVRSPYFGLWGTVIQPPSGLTRLETEVEARVLRVRLDDGRVVPVAEANVEI